MARLTKNSQLQNKILYGEGIIDSIVLLAVNEIPFVELDSETPATKQAKSNDIRVKKDKDGIHVDVTVKIHYTQCVSDMAFKIQEAIRHSVETMTEFHVSSVNVNINGVTFEDKVEEIPEQSNTNENNKEGTV